ncbi:MAG: acyl carrier protein [Halioglobus sp.]
MHSKESIQQHITNVLVELFEIEAEAIVPSAQLMDDLDIDSIDAVDIALQMQELTGEKIQPEDFKEITTVQDLIDAVFGLVDAGAA